MCNNKVVTSGTEMHHVLVHGIRQQHDAVYVQLVVDVVDPLWIHHHYQHVPHHADGDQHRLIAPDRPVEYPLNPPLI